MRENHLNWVLYTSGMLALRMDDDRDGRPKTTERVRSGIEEALNEDRRKTIDELADHVDASHRTVYYNKRIKDDQGISTLGPQTFE